MITLLVLLVIILVIASLEKLTSNKGEKLGCVSGPVAVIMGLYVFYLLTSGNVRLALPNQPKPETMIPGDFEVVPSKSFHIPTSIVKDTDGPIGNIENHAHNLRRFTPNK